MDILGGSKMNDIIPKESISVENMIYEIRGKQVMLDSDLARLYNVETKRINEAVKNNPNKFPERFSFRITEVEYNNLKSKISTSSLNNYGGSRKGHTVFTEQGVAMLATILKSKVATEVSIRIMDAFVAMRHYISDNLIEQRYINNLVLEHDNRINLLQKSLDKLSEKRKVNEIYFDGQVYDAYSKVLDIFKEANEELIIVDRYTDKTMLDMIKYLECNVILITGKCSKITKLDINKYNKQYHNLALYYDDSFHDRYIIIDEQNIYHSGNSLNYIGYRKSCIDRINDQSIKNALLNDIKRIVDKKTP